MNRIPDIDGALALAQGRRVFDIDLETNTKLARISLNGQPSFVIQVDTEKLHIWVETGSLTSFANSVNHDIRQFGFDVSGNPASSGQPGMHSGLRPFFGTNELTCFNPASLDEAWSLIKAF
ncbi:MAG: hypothetical protein ABJF89_02435 [Parasphingorhabdus sp.]|uniref:hypothetical protein n=1 Tax=Parasphingorhabdus sp. TaxID=2709688 RepID=UPI003266C116